MTERLLIGRAENAAFLSYALAMQVVERSFDSLKAAPQRVGHPNLRVSYSPVLEETVLSSVKKIEEVILRTMG